VWPLRPAVTVSGDRLLLQCEVRTGLTLDAAGNLKELSQQEFEKKQAELLRMP